MRNIIQDLRQTLRMIRTNPGFAAVAVITLGLGIAANTTVFSWVRTVLLRPIPGVPAAHELASLEGVGPTGARLGQFPHPDFRDFQSQMTTAQGVFASHVGFFTIGPPEAPRRVLGHVVSANYFAVLGVKPLLGRMFTPAEDVDTPGACPHAVISHRLWRTYFRQDPQVVGRTVRINGHPYTVAGVAQPDFAGTFGGAAFDVWIPLSMIIQTGTLNTWAAADRNARFLEVVIRLKPGVRIEQAREEARVVAARIAAAHPDTHRGIGAALVPMAKATYGLQAMLGDPLRILMAVCVLVLLIACANVANLLVARSLGRQREFAIRAALGAQRRQLVRQLLTEVSVLAGGGALLGVALAQWMAESLAYVLPALDLPARNAIAPLLQLKTDGMVLLYTALIAAGASVLAALMPAWYAGRVDVNEALKDGGRSGTAGAKTHRLRGALVVAEVALATLALIGAGLAVRNFRQLAQVKLGMEPEGVLVAHFYLSTNGYKLDQEKQFARNLRARLETVAGIEQVSYGNAVPLSLYTASGDRVQPDGVEGDESGVMTLPLMAVAPGYFDLMRIARLEGRDFTENDDLKHERVVIVNQTFARKYFAGVNPVGRKLRVSGKRVTVVGLVRDSKYRTPGEEPKPFLYGPFGQKFWSGHGHFLYVRARNLDLARAALRREVAALDPNRGLYEASTLVEYSQAGLFGERVAASMLSALGVLALALAAVGLYSVMAYAVGERRQEIGIRMALGARRAEVLAMVLRTGLGMAGVGLGIGAAAAVAGVKVLGSSVEGPLSAAHPVVFAAVAAILAATSLLATSIPAHRATRVDPMTALRSE